MAKHKFIIEPDRNGGATLWYSSPKDGKLYCVRRFTKEEQLNGFEMKCEEAALEYKKRFL